MHAWRICKEQYSKKSFSGDGGLKAAGRWHHKGHRIVYTAQSLSLATIELWVHVDPEEPLFTYVAVAADIPDNLVVQRFDEADLPSNWRDDPGPTELRDLGTAWLRSQSSAVARVPSVATPGEFNYLLNPEHPDFGSIQIGTPIEFVFDRRMWKIREQKR
ncbi:MAG: RES family NAD+ phosphorylase [Bryobacteraceae bacterium]